jgi:hypothetical protein
VSSSTIADHPAGGVTIDSIVAGTTASVTVAASTLARNARGIEANAALDAGTLMLAANNQISQSTSAGIFANGADASVRASGNAIFGGPYGLRVQGGGTI